MARFSLSPPISPSIRKQQQPQSHSSLSSPSARVSLSTSALKFQYNFPPRPLPSSNIDVDNDSFDSSDEDEQDSSSELSFDGSSDANYENEPLHPLGFQSRFGKTRFGLSPNWEPPKDISHGVDQDAWSALLSSHKVTGEMIQSFPPIHNYFSHRDTGLSARALWNGAINYTIAHNGKQTNAQEEAISGIDRIANRIKAATSLNVNHQSYSSLTATSPPVQQQECCLPTSTSKLVQLAQACDHHLKVTLPSQMSQLQTERKKSYDDSCAELLLMLQAEEVSAQQARLNISQRQQRQEQQQEQQKRLQSAQEVEHQKRLEEEKQLEFQRKQLEDAKSREEQLKQQEQLEQIRQAEAEAELEAKSKQAYIDRAKQLVANLDIVRSSLKNFETCKSVAKQRLQFKKIVNGKINTLSHDDTKIIEVADIVIDAIQLAEVETFSTPQNDSAVGAMAKKYLLDLLASSLIVRVQADGFNGTRGDGFPLANMFAAVSLRCEELSPILESHLYTVCPMAVPTLSNILESSGVKGNDEDWMEGLGMIRESSGQFESFDKFLHRTEGLISIMADVMSSHPSSHTLLGGQDGALTWLERFLDLLPSPPASPLPLLTAPVLVAFLTGAGHMLANQYPDKFQPLFDTIKLDIMGRLDDSPTGVPSATRLEKVIESGFIGLKNNLPPGSIASLYNGKEGSGTALVASSSTMYATRKGQGDKSLPSIFGSSQLVSSNSTSFGADDADRSSSFGNSMMDGNGAANILWTNSSNNTNFLSSTSTTNKSSFLSSSMNINNTSSPASNNGPFSTSNWGIGSSMQTTSANGFESRVNPFQSHNSNPFSDGKKSNISLSPFSTQTNDFSKSTTTTTTQSPFGAFTSSSMTKSGNSFGSSATSTPVASPFGASLSSSISKNNNPFGSGAVLASPTVSPFGAFSPSSQSQTNNPFARGASTQSKTPFSGGAMSNSFENKKDESRVLCKYFSSGSCRYGDNCKFSHDSSSRTNLSVGNNVNSSSPFGGSGSSARTFSSSPFSSNTSTAFGSSSFGTASPFSANNAPKNPFGAPRR